jgi:hypothetical protein
MIPQVIAMRAGIVFTEMKSMGDRSNCAHRLRKLESPAYRKACLRGGVA